MSQIIPLRKFPPRKTKITRKKSQMSIAIQKKVKAKQKYMDLEPPPEKCPPGPLKTVGKHYVRLKINKTNVSSK